MELDHSHVWITTRRLKPGTREQFSQAWRPKTFVSEKTLASLSCGRFHAEGEEG